MTIEIELFMRLVAQGVQIHLATFDEFIKKCERKLEFADDGLEFLIHNECRVCAFASEFHICTPGGETGAALFDGMGFFIRHIIYLTAERIECSHGASLGLWQEDECKCEIGRAVSSDRLTLLHGGQFW